MLRLVGPFGIERDGRVLTGGVVGAARSRSLLAALVIAGPDGSTASALAAKVWRRPPATWSSALRGAIASLRAALAPLGLDGQALVVTTGNGWALAPDAITDIVEARDRVTEAEAALGAGSPGPALQLPKALLPVLAGTVLPADDADWLESLRGEHRAVRSAAWTAVGAAALLAGDATRALDAADQLLALDPLAEPAYRLAIRARRAAGDRAGAIEAFERCRRTLAEELGVDPSPETVALHLDVLRSGSASGGTLPALPRDGFFGRSAEITAVAEALTRPGVVELVGRGGIGKSRLALHAAHEEAARLPGGRFWAPLGGIDADELVGVTVAAAIGAATTGDPAGAIVDRLGPAGPTLLVLDGCELVTDGVADLVATLREALPALRVLVTSRSPLDLPLATRVDVASLPLPEGNDLAGGSALLLLADRVALRGGRLAAGAETAPFLQDLCRRCEGVPLALELAAAQLASVAVGDLLDVLGEAGTLATSVLQTLLAQSRAALDADETAVFDALAVIDGQVPLAIVRGMVSPEVSGGRVARVLGALDLAALVEIDRAGPRWRYGLDDELRRLARRDGAGSSSAVLDRLAGTLDGVAPRDPGTAPAEYRAAVDDAADAFRAVFAAAVEGRFDRGRALDLAFRLHRYWTVSRLVEGRYWLGRLLEDAPAGEGAALARFAAGYLGYWASDPAALPLLRSAARELESARPAFAARALIFAAGLADDLDEVASAREDILAAVALAELAGSTVLRVNATVGAAAIIAERGDPTAVEYLDEALALQDPAADGDQRVAALANAARIAWHVGDHEAARRYADGARSLLDGAPRIAQVQLACAVGGIAFVEGRLDDAAAAAELASTAARTLQLDREIPLTTALGARIALARGASEEARALALDCLRSVVRLQEGWPAALALETAAVVLGADLAESDRVALIGAASTIRLAGDRPAPSALRLTDGREGTGPVLLPTSEAVEVALRLLER